MFRLPSKWRDVPVDMAAEVLFRAATFAGFFVASYAAQWVLLGIWLQSVMKGPGVERMLDSPLATEGYLAVLAERFLYSSLIIAALASTLGVTIYRFTARRRYDRLRAAARQPIAETRDPLQETESVGYAAPEQLRETAENASEPSHAPVQSKARRTQERQPRSESMWTQLELPKEQPETRERL